MTSADNNIESGQWNGLERRHHKRLSISCYIVFRPIEQKGRLRHYMPGDLVNISLGGMKFRANSEIEAHSRIKIRLRMFDILSSDESANLDRIAEQMETVVVAKVLECRKSKTTGYDYRVKFESFRQGNLAVLAKFIQEQTA